MYTTLYFQVEVRKRTLIDQQGCDKQLYDKKRGDSTELWEHFLVNCRTFPKFDPFLY